MGAVNLPAMGQRVFTSALAAALVFVGVFPALAAAQSTDAAEAVDFRGYYVEGDAADIDAMERLSEDYSSAGFGFVALEDDPSGGADLFAAEVASASSASTVIVVSQGEIGYVSEVFEDAELDAAVDAAFDLFDRGYEEGFRRFASELSGVAVATSVAAEAITTPTVAPQAQSDAPEQSSGGGGFFVFFLIAAAVIGFIWWRSRKNKERVAAAREGQLELLKDEVRKEMSGAANEILELEDRIRVADDDRASELYAAGAQGYAEFQDQLERANTPEALHDLGNMVDKTLWQLEAAEAIIEGRDVPPEPEPEPFPEPQPPDGAEPRRRADLPPELDMRRAPRQRMPQAPRSRGGGLGSLGGLGSIAVILREMQRSSQTQSSRRRTGFGRRPSRSSEVQVPRLPGAPSGTRPRSSRSSPDRSGSTSPSSRGRIRGRGRRKRR